MDMAQISDWLKSLQNLLKPYLGYLGLGGAGAVLTWFNNHRTAQAQVRKADAETVKVKVETDSLVVKTEADFARVTNERLLAAMDALKEQNTITLQLLAESRKEVSELRDEVTELRIVLDRTREELHIAKSNSKAQCEKCKDVGTPFAP